jgi:hypothetical protein
MEISKALAAGRTETEVRCESRNTA